MTNHDHQVVRLNDATGMTSYEGVPQVIESVESDAAGQRFRSADIPDSDVTLFQHDHDDDRPSMLTISSSASTKELPNPPILLGPVQSFLSSTLYNREDLEIQLRQTYRRVRDSETPELILISGPSGSGKVQLAKSLHDTVREDGGTLLMGKFDQLQRPEPYRAYVTAFTEFANLVTLDATKLSEVRRAILEAVGEGAGVLTDMIPALERVLGHQDRAYMANQGGAITSFVFVFRLFVKSLCSREHPLVLVLDDMQWSDACSLDLLTSLLTDKDSKGAIFVGTCDDNIPSDSTLSASLRKLEDVCNVTITNISVGNMSKDEVSDILLHKLQLPYEQSIELGDIMFAQTQGNLFYLTEFVKWLEEEKLVEYNRSLMQWKLHTQEISLSITCCCPGDFMIDKAEQLPADTKEVLKVASCLGSVLDEELLRLILDFDVCPCLKFAAEKGFLVSDKHGYTFAHDATQKAAYRLIPYDTRNAFHLMIGRTLWRKLDDCNVDSNIFTVVSQFCLSANLIQEKDEKEAVAGLCLHAGRKAAKASTFRTASIYLNFGIQLLGPACWKDYYVLSLQLYNAAAEMELCVGNYNRMDELLNSVFENVQDFRDKLQAHATRIYSLSIRDQQQQAIVEGSEVLKDLGETFPTRLRRPRIMREIATVRSMLRGKSDSMLMRLPPMEDPTKLATIQILDLMYLSALIARPSFVPFLVLKAMKVTLQQGSSPWTATSFSMYGMLCCTIGNVDDGYRYGQLALKLLETSQHREFLPRVYAAVYGCINCWKKPITAALEPLHHAHRVGLETGDVEFSFLNACLYCLNSMEAGMKLSLVEKSLRGFYELMVTRNQKSLLQVVTVFLQTLHHLMGLTNDPLAPAGDVIDYGEAFNHATETNNSTLKTAILIERTMLAYVFNAFDIARELADQWRADIFCIPPGPDLISACFFDGVVALVVASRDKKARKKYLRIADSRIRRLKKWSGDSPHNCLDKLFVMEAERASISGQDKLAYEKYVCANALAADSGCLWVQAIANERAGEHLDRRGERALAQVFFNRAADLWDQWGAHSKAQNVRVSRNENPGG